MPVPLDEYPVHQVPLSMARVATSDRNAYDRCYFNAHDRTGEVFLVTGMGSYPNLGVTDAFVTVRRGDSQVSVRASDALGDDRLRQVVGPFRVEVLDPLHAVRVRCDGDDHGVGFDLTWRATSPAVDEPQHVMRRDGRIILDAHRFAQTGAWSGTLRLGDDELTVTDDRWIGTRDRSWGIRPVGEAEPSGRAGAEPSDRFGFWWVYVPLKFEDYALILMAQEDGDGFRTHNEAVRVWCSPTSERRAPEQLGWPRFEIGYRAGSRHPEGAVIHLTEPDGKPLAVDVETLGFVALNCGAGYGGDPEWSHGQWRGRGWVEGGVLDMNDPAVAGRVPYGVVDHVARATLEGDEGWGMFEHGTFGRHAPSGFTDWGSVAP